ncbi:uncharacterized protein METZ01_LOCUS107153, partial [marine metagenome]
MYISDKTVKGLLSSKPVSIFRSHPVILIRLPIGLQP